MGILELIFYEVLMWSLWFFITAAGGFVGGLVAGLINGRIR